MNTFTPSARQSNWLIAIGFLAFGYAIYLRYMIMENVQAGLTCDGGHKSWLCFSRMVFNALDVSGTLGWIALGAAVIAFIRPGVVLLSIALVTAALALVLHNGGLGGLAGGLILLSFARPVPAPE
jgi:hypothetical protein